ncbi:MAG: LytTR family DNA-binding domain-containing protein, partial [Bacteroidales bacterium]
RQQLAERESDREDGDKPANLLFTDDKGVLRLSIRYSDLLYIEADDNYVTIHYSAAKKVKRFLIRTTLKRLQVELSDTSVVRCHRSYLVNFDRVKSMRREGENIFLELESEEVGPLPVSKSYRSAIAQRFMDSSPSNRVV